MLALAICISLLASPLHHIEAESTQATLAQHNGAPIYLALGDSLAVGVGASEPAMFGYVPLLHETIKDDRRCGETDNESCPELVLVNLAEGGATTTSLRDTQLPAALALIGERNNDDIPTNDVSVITITIGGNDAFNALAPVCADGLTPICGQVVQQTLASIDVNLTETLVHLRAAAGPDTTIVTMTYFNSLLDCDLQAAVENADLILEGLPGISPGLNGIIREAAARADVSVAETFGRLGPDDLVGGEDCLHANDSGYLKIAEAFASVLLPLPDSDAFDARPKAPRATLAR